MKKVLLTLLAIFGMYYSHAQVTVTLGSALLQNPGSDLHLPVSVKGLNGATGGIGVAGIELHIAYSSTNLVYDTTLNFNSLTPTSQWFYGGNGIEYSTNWLEPAGQKLNIPDNTVLFEIVFHYLGGATALTFDTARCLLVDSAYNIIPGVRYVNGQVTPSQGSGESRWNGTGTWNTIANWSNGIPGDSTNAIIETGEVSAFSNAVCKSISINQSTVINIEPDFSLTVNRNYDNKGTINLLSDATGTGSLLVRGVVSGTGINNFNRHLGFGSGNPYLVSSPVSAATASVFGANIAEKYVESSATWMAISGFDNLESGVGYRINGPSPSTVKFSGVFSTSDVTRGNLAYTGSQPETLRGLNLLGNPYPSAIQWEQGNWGRNNLDYAVYVWNGYKYITWNGSIGALKDGIIPAMQGFIVKSNAANASLNIPAGSRIHSTMPYYKSTDAVSSMISMRVVNTTDTSHFDEAFVQILNGTMGGFDGNHDAWKLEGNNAYPQIFTKGSDQSTLSINTQPDYVSIPVEVKTPGAGSYKISFRNIESFDPGQPLFFEDKTSNTVINIRNSNEFVFTSDGGTESGRFVLHFQEVGLMEHAQSKITAWADGNEIHLSSVTGNAHIVQIEVFNLTGRPVVSASNFDLPATIPAGNLTTGLHIMRIKTDDGVYTQKLLIQKF